MTTKGIRVVVGISGSHHELLNDLSALPVRDRAERIRTLATIGLMAARGTVDLNESAPKATIQRQKSKTSASEKSDDGGQGIGSGKARDFARKIGGF